MKHLLQLTILMTAAAAAAPAQSLGNPWITPPGQGSTPLYLYSGDCNNTGVGPGTVACQANWQCSGMMRGVRNVNPTASASCTGAYLQAKAWWDLPNYGYYVQGDAVVFRYATYVVLAESYGYYDCSRGLIVLINSPLGSC
jgi:hypothetical protein